MDRIFTGVLYALWMDLNRSAIVRVWPAVLTTVTLAIDNSYLMAAYAKTSHYRTPLFHEVWIDRYVNHDFFIHFRMTRLTFERLVRTIAPYHIRPYERGLPHVSLDKAAMMAVWYLSKGEVLVSISDRFDVAVSTVHDMVWLILEYFNKLKSTVIVWPNHKEAKVIAREFFALGSFPDVIGAIDGCHVHVKPPRDHHDSYLNRKFTHSVVLQGICTSKKFLININAGWPGNVHDARVLQESSLVKHIERYGVDQYFYSRYHLIGDSAYPCRSWLMTPYRDTGHLTEAEKTYNRVLSKTRVVIEMTFGLLKGRWRILNYINVNSPRRMVQIIVACCVLHNFCLLENDFFEEMVELETYPEDSSTSVVTTSGNNKRETIKDLLTQSPARLAKRRRIM